ncbi:hypothetical protein NLU13_4195 [Sarocladium strictum]|uniref:Uncharacterized protein n=1 Tax=Sarocladium strictum TaxID=5046 RepID=A0AA39GIS1_SARSR|nr:hypothetical protein NLU13_4195 [Sarocladium strictum]
MPSRVELPENVSIYAGPNSEGLLGAKVLTRLVTTVPDAEKLSQALASQSDFASFCHQHGRSVLIFDGEDQDLHHEHFRQVCLCLKDNGDIGLEYGQCVFDAGTALEAGFQTDKLESGAIMVVDLRHGEEDESSESEDDGA